MPRISPVGIIQLTRAEAEEIVQERRRTYRPPKMTMERMAELLRHRRKSGGRLQFAGR